jgi:hypothetical protein
VCTPGAARIAGAAKWLTTEAALPSTVTFSGQFSLFPGSGTQLSLDTCQR